MTSLREVRARRAATAVFVVLASAAAARAEVTRVDIARRADLGASGYEKIIGTIHFAVDPRHPRNRIVVDLDKAPVNAAGRVEFSSDLYILRPKPPRGNGAALVDVLNRGNKVVLNGFNRGGSPDPASEDDLGDRFLMRFGYTVVWVGWEFDLDAGPPIMRIQAPIATDRGKTITGVVRTTFTPTVRAAEFPVADLSRYDAVDPAGPDSRLTVRSQMPGARGEPIPRSDWGVSGHTVTLDRGFEPGLTYEISYRAANPPVAGLGFVALRDTAAWLKHEPDAVASVRYAYGFGLSQSGRVLRDFLYQGFNTDERDRQVFDAVMAHVAGASRISLNERWAKPAAGGPSGAAAFPFADASLRDPIGGAHDGLLENSRMGEHAPKVFYTNTPVEYWGTRAAALVHTTPAGTADLPLRDNVRVYFIAGTQHLPSHFPAEVTNGQQADNAIDYWWAMRALLLAMHKWVKEGVVPPPSQYPRLRDRTLVPVSAVAFPAIPGVRSPRALTSVLARPLLVPEVDEDGNERAGIRLPEVAVPLATYTGWNFRQPAIGAPDALAPLIGSTILFPATRAEREAARDPRRSIEERYASRDEYLTRVEQALDVLIRNGYIVYDDGPRILQRAGDQWDLATVR